MKIQTGTFSEMIQYLGFLKSWSLWSYVQNKIVIELIIVEAGLQGQGNLLKIDQILYEFEVLITLS